MSELSENEAIKTLSEKRAEVITSIFRNGLQSQPDLLETGITFMGSADQQPRPFVSSALINPDYNSIPSALYGGEDSVMPVLIERKGTINFFFTKEDAPLFSQRIQSSFMVIWKKGENEQFGDRKTVYPSEILGYIFPEKIWEEYAAISKEKQPSSPIMTVKDNVNKKVRGLVLDVPDYEKALEELLKKENVPLCIHGVRLPIEHD